MKTNIASKREALVEQINSAARSRNDFHGSIKAVPSYQSPSFSGKTDFKDVTTTYNPEYSAKDDEDFSRVYDADVEHEIVHKQDGKGRGCPKTDEHDLDDVLVPISKVLKTKGIPNVPFGMQGHTVYTYFANLLEDFVVNNIGVENRGSQGFFGLYDELMRHSDVSELYEAFVKLQAATFPHKAGISRVIKHFKQSKKASEVYRTFLEKTGLMKLEKDDRVAYLSDISNWPQLSKTFAEEFSQLIDPEDLAKSWFPLFGGNDFTKLDDEDVQMEIAIKAYAASKGKFEPPPFMDDNLALLSLYRRFAKDIDVKAETTSVETRRQIAHTGIRKFDFDKDSLEQLSVGIDETGKIEHQTGRYPLTVVSRYQISAGHWPEVRIGLLDCSDSTRRSLGRTKGKVMNPWAQENKQWTDTSIFHQELICFFGLCELFIRKGTLKNSNVRLGVFSDATRLAKDLTESEQLALQPEFGGTTMSEKYLDEFFAGKGSLLYTISDGDVANWAQIKNKFIKLAKKHLYFHMQVGSETQMYRDLKSAGLTAVLDDGTNSAKTLIDLTQIQVYGAKG